MMKRHANTYMDLLIISALGLVPLLWFRDGYNAVAGFDFAVYLDPVATLKKNFYLWSDLMAGGYDLSHEVSSMAYYLLFSFPLLLGASFYSAEKFLFVAIFTLQGLSMYYMLRTIMGADSVHRAASLLGAIFYMFSYPVMAHFGRGNFIALLTYGLLPFVVGLLRRGFYERKRRWRYITLIALISFPVSATKGHPADFLVFLWVVLFYTFFHAITSKREKAVHILSFAAKALLVTILVNLWWILPNTLYLMDFGLSRADMLREGFYDLDILSFYSRGTSILNMFRNERLDLWFDTPPDPVLNAAIYQKWCFVLIGLFMPLLGLAALFKKRVGKDTLFFALLFVMAVFLGKGNHPPLGKAFEWLLLNFPGFLFFRAPYRVFSSLITFSLVPLMAATMAEIISNRRECPPTDIKAAVRKGPESWALSRKLAANIAVSCFVILVLSLNFVNAWPLFTGSHLKERGTDATPGVFHRMPAYYGLANHWLMKKKGGFKVYNPVEVYDVNTGWGYNGPDPGYELLEVPKVVSRPNGTVYVRYQRPIEELNRLVWNWRYGDAKKVLGLFNVHYAVIDEDINPWTLPSHNFIGYADSFFERNGMPLERKFGALRFYRNDAYLPRIFAARKGYLLSGSIRSFPALSLTPLIKEPSFIMAEDAGPETNPDELLEGVEGVILYNTNHVDTALMLLSGSYGGTLSKGRFRFKAAESGPYSVYLRIDDTTGIVAALDKRLLLRSKGGPPEDGLRWKRLGTMALEKGEHLFEVRSLWTPDTDIVIAPAGALQRLMEKLLSRMADKGFEVIYLLDSFDMSGLHGGRLNLPGKEDFFINAMRPREFYINTIDALKGEDFRLVTLKGGARITGKDGKRRLVIKGVAKGREIHLKLVRESLNIDPARYNELIIGKSGKNGPGTGDVRISYIFRVRTNGVGRKLVIPYSEGIERLDLYERLKNHFYGEVNFVIEGLTVDIRAAAPKDEEVRLELDVPALIGRFGLLEKNCRKARGVLSVGKDRLGAGPFNYCNRWVDGGALKPGLHKINLVEGGEKNLVMITKGPAPLHASIDPPETVFQKVNPAMYSGIVKAKQRHYLVFSDSYDSGWMLRVDNSTLNPVRVNGFANGFLIDQGGTYRFTLEYRPQRIYRYSTMVSVLSMALLIVGVSWSGAWKKGL